MRISFTLSFEIAHRPMPCLMVRLSQPLILDALSRLGAAVVGVLFLHQLRHIIGLFDEFGRSVPAGHDQLDLSLASADQVKELFFLENLEKEGVQDLVADEQVGFSLQPPARASTPLPHVLCEPVLVLWT